MIVRSSALALFLLGALTTAAPSYAADAPYDAKADAKADVARALSAAKDNGKPVLLEFGANWCPDCRALNQALSTGALRGFVSGNFNLAKVDVGNWDKNLDLSKRYGDPIGKGIPSVVVLSTSGAMIASTKTGELADARHMGDAALIIFFRSLAASKSAAPVSAK